MRKLISAAPAMVLALLVLSLPLQAQSPVLPNSNPNPTPAAPPPAASSEPANTGAIFQPYIEVAPGVEVPVTEANKMSLPAAPVRSAAPPIGAVPYSAALGPQGPVTITSLEQQVAALLQRIGEIEGRIRRAESILATSPQAGVPVVQTQNPEGAPAGQPVLSPARPDRSTVDSREQARMKERYNAAKAAKAAKTAEDAESGTQSKKSTK